MDQYCCNYITVYDVNEIKSCYTEVAVLSFHAGRKNNYQKT